jgi:hypothetical protein
MNQPLRPEVEEAFAVALEMSEAEQERFLARKYAYDPELGAESKLCCVLIELPAPSSSLTDHTIMLPRPEPRLILPAAIGRYRILRLLGEGGMAVVYEAEQEQPRRTVALKVIKPGLAVESLRRFEQESQVLGQLQHPGIAQIYEAGTADTEFVPQPYFADGVHTRCIAARVCRRTSIERPPTPGAHGQGL